jgi:phosphoribosylamine--glycine ligase
VVDATLHQRIMDEVIMPTVNGMAADGYVYTGFLYAGIMVDSDGTPKVLEFNCRFGDPETQPIMMRLKNSIVELCVAGTMGVLDQTIAHWDSRPAVGVVLAAKGYPDAYPKGDVISLPEELGQTSKIFHAGTTLNDEGMVTTNGGRVLCAVALGDTVGEAQHKAYELADQITWEGKFCRRDIGYRAIAREQLH